MQECIASILFQVDQQPFLNVTTVEVNVTTKDHHYLVVKVNSRDVHYHYSSEGQYILFYLF